MRKYLPCDRVAYDPYDHNSSHTRNDVSDSDGDSSNSAMGAALTVVSVVAVAATALLVLSLWRQQHKSR